MSESISRETLIEALQGDREAIAKLHAAVNGQAAAGTNQVVATPEQFNAAVDYKARALAEKWRVEYFYPELWKDPAKIVKAMEVDKRLLELHKNWPERLRFESACEEVVANEDPDIDRAEEIARKKLWHARAQAQAGEAEGASEPTREDIEVAESQAAYDAHVREAVADAVQRRQPREVRPLTAEEQLRNERIEYARRMQGR